MTKEKHTVKACALLVDWQWGHLLQWNNISK